jgi:hypothetical protein
VGLLTDTVNLGAINAMTGASLTGTDLAVNNGGELLEAVISSIEMSKSAANADTFIAIKAVMSPFFMAL